MAALEQQSHGRMNPFEVFFIVFWLRYVVFGCNLFFVLHVRQWLYSEFGNSCCWIVKRGHSQDGEGFHKGLIRLVMEYECVLDY